MHLPSSKSDISFKYMHVFMIQNMIISIFQGGGGRGFRILIFNLVTIHPIGDYDSRICTLGYHYS